MCHTIRCLAWVVAVVALAAGSAPAVNIDLVPVGNPGNPGQLSGFNTVQDDPAICGGVDYSYWVGKFEITTGQYTDFLNAVAATDTYGVYNPYMDIANSPYGCNIKRSGSPGGYTYSVPSDWANRPVSLVSWGDAARFANWLTNGQPTGAQTAATTEDGSYALNGATTDAQLLAVTRKANARYVIPTEDEWYKAAYHKNDGPTGHYWDFPTTSDTIDASMANYQWSVGRTTDVGTYASFPSSYGTFDQGGNVWEWNEAVWHSVGRGLRGSSFVYPGSIDGYTNSLSAEYRYGGSPARESEDIGFRIALVPEPASVAILSLAMLVMLRRRHYPT